MSPEQVAELLGVTRKTVLRWARDGRIPSVVAGRTVFFLRADVDAWVLRQRRGIASIGE